MSALGCASEHATFQRLIEAWAEPHRRYHSTSHLNACLATFDEYRELARRPAEVELALWFHDAIYSARGKQDEERSADWAREFLQAAETDAATVERVVAMILATCHNAEVTDPDEQLVVDVDLSILGRGSAVYDEFETAVREEYRWVPSPLFRRERRKVLRAFLERPHIYHTRRFRDRFEANARKNMERAIERLGG